MSLLVARQPTKSRKPLPVHPAASSDELAAKLAEALERALLVQAGQPEIARNVGGQDGGKFSGRVHAMRPCSVASGTEK
jgi:hypothetical protein